MDRRQFSIATGLAGTVFISQTAAQAQESKQQLIEFRRYDLINMSQQRSFHTYAEKAAIPAWNRLGIKPVGAFTVTNGETTPSIYVLLPHPNMESVITLERKLLEDKEYFSAGKEFIESAISNPAFLRINSSLMLGFKDMPTVEVPVAIKGKDSRLFELRIYESHNEVAAKKKIEMFNEGGEIAIFKKTGLDPIFFGESITGERLPNLTYMLGFADMAAKDQAWNNFRDSPDWKALSGDTQYRDTVSNITDIILRPTAYSQI